MIEMQGKKYEEREILTIHLAREKDKIAELISMAGRVKMIPVRGTAEGEIFTGEILPGGCDTHVEDLAMICHMSARFVMKGNDCFGNSCQIYVESNGHKVGSGKEQSYACVPTFMTDSEKLATYLHTNQFIARAKTEDDTMTIHVYELQKVKN